MVGGSHTYASGGSYTMFVTIHDTDGTSAVGLGTATVAQVSPYVTVALGFLQSGEYDNDLVIKDYQQYLARTPTPSEVAYWDNLLANGTSDTQVLAGFLSSAEFFTRAGNSNKAWVDALYLDLLGRSADASGETYWLRQLAGGASMYDVALGFVNSQEHESLVVQSYYQQFLGRTGSTTEVAYWVNAIHQGSSDAQVLAGFLSSQAYYSRVGNTDKAWVDSLYHQLLKRDPNSTEESYWLHVLAADGV